MNRSEKRALAKKLVTEYGVSFDMAVELIKHNLHNRAIVLATGEPDPKKAFVAAANALLLALRQPMRFKSVDELLKFVRS